MNWFIYVLTKKYISFDGRASRSEYWFFTLFTVIIYIFFLFTQDIDIPQMQNKGMMLLLNRQLRFDFSRHAPYGPKWQI